MTHPRKSLYITTYNSFTVYSNSRNSLCAINSLSSDFYFCSFRPFLLTKNRLPLRSMVLDFLNCCYLGVTTKIHEVTIHFKTRGTIETPENETLGL